MTRLSDAAIALLRRLPTDWTSYEEAGLDEAARGPWLELVGQGLAESRVHPPPDLGRRRSPIGRAIDDRVQRTTEVRVTSRGQHRLARIEGRFR